MRSSDNLKKFNHVTKTRQERADYTDLVSGTTRESGIEKDSFDETSNKSEPSGNPEDINIPKQPYKSWRTWFKESGKNISILGVAISILGWAALTFIDYGKDIAKLDANYENMKTDVTAIKNKYEGLNEKSITAGVLLGEIQKDLSDLKQRVYNLPKQ